MNFISMHSLESRIDCYRGWVNPFDEDYSFQDNLEKVRNLHDSGTAVGLLMGRCPEEGLYNESNSETQHWAYCCDHATGAAPDDIMFLVDFMDPEYLKQFPDNFFSHIVFDVGVAKDMDQTGGGDLYAVFQEYHRILAEDGILSMDQSGMSCFQLTPAQTQYHYNEELFYNRCITGDVRFEDTVKPGFKELMQKISEASELSEWELYELNEASERGTLHLEEKYPDLQSWSVHLSIIHALRQAERIAEHVHDELMSEAVAWNRLKTQSVSDILYKTTYQELVQHTLENFRLLGFHEVEWKCGRPWGNCINGDYYYCKK